MIIRTIHLVSLNIPYPPDYGGMIDIYYKIKALSEAGFHIILHAFKYNRDERNELNSLCSEVHYYERKTGFIQNLSRLPYIVYSRRSEALITNLLKDEYPVIFEGLHSCYHLRDPRLKNRVKVVRTHNIEHYYYRALARTVSNPLRKLYFYVEAMKLKKAQERLKFADCIAAISPQDMEYFQKRFQNVVLLNPFHSNTGLNSKTGKGSYLLYHANLSVYENIHALEHLVKNVFNHIDFPIIVAGKAPSQKVLELCSSGSQVTLVRDPGKEEMDRLIRDAQAIILYTEQATGIKLKLIDSLYMGRFCIVNPKMTEGTGLEKSCIVAEDPGEMVEMIKKILSSEFSEERISERSQLLKEFDVRLGVRQIESIIYS